MVGWAVPRLTYIALGCSTVCLLVHYIYLRTTIGPQSLGYLDTVEHNTVEMAGKELEDKAIWGEDGEVF